METLKDIILLLDTQMKVPQPYGWFHLLCFFLTGLLTVVFCVFCKHRTRRQVMAIVVGTAIVVAILEIYKQFNFTFSYVDGKVIADYLWYAFPWQFCSMPMYVGLLLGIFRKGKIHDSLCAFLATYSIFAGVCVMLYPTSVFVGEIGINIQTMVCHGSMITIGIYLLYTGYVKLEHKTILKAIPVFVCGVLSAVVMNEVAYYTGLLETDTFNMFFISPHCEPSLPVYSLIQAVVPYPWCLIIYVSAFSLAAYVILLLAMAIRNVVKIMNKNKQNVRLLQC